MALGVAADSSNWRTVFGVRISGWGVDISIGIVFVALIALLVIAGAVGRRRSKGWKVTSADFTFAGCATVTMCPTDDVARLAHQAWIEITTRKASIPFDDDNDLIVEVYNSWYALFKALRDLSKGVPIRKGMRKDSDESKLVEILTGALNVGLRPHLTKWQARFRRWYDAALADSSNSSRAPQDIQRDFPQYGELVADLRNVNDGMSVFAESLRSLAHERERLPFWKLWN